MVGDLLERVVESVKTVTRRPLQPTSGADAGLSSPQVAPPLTLRPVVDPSFLPAVLPPVWAPEKPNARGEVKVLVRVLYDLDGSAFRSSVFDVMHRLRLEGQDGLQGLIVVPKHVRLYEYASEIETAAQHGVLVEQCPVDSYAEWISELPDRYHDLAELFSENAAAFSHSMSARKIELDAIKSALASGHAAR